MSLRAEVSRYQAVWYLRSQLSSVFPSKVPARWKEHHISSWILNEHIFGQGTEPLIPKGSLISLLMANINNEHSALGITMKDRDRDRVAELCSNITLSRIVDPHVSSKAVDGVKIFRIDHKKGVITIQIPQHLYERLSARHHVDILPLFLRYHTMGRLIDQVRIPESLIRDIQSVVPLTGELFSSFFNRVVDGLWFSMFPDIETQLGSSGSYFVSQIPSGTYIVNPPNDEFTLQQLSIKIVRDMKGASVLTYIIFIPSQSKHVECVAHSDYVRGSVKISDMMMYNPIHESHVSVGSYDVIVASNDPVFSLEDEIISVLKRLRC